MTEICRMSLPPPAGRAQPSGRARAPAAALADADRRKLKQHLRQCRSGLDAASPFLAYVLRRKIDAARPLAEDDAAGDVVSGGALVTYAICEGGCEGPEQSGLLVHRARSDAPASAASGVIAVTSLLGATLIGMHVGQRAPLLCEDGTIVSVCVRRVAAPA